MCTGQLNGLICKIKLMQAAHIQSLCSLGICTCVCVILGFFNNVLSIAEILYYVKVIPR